MSFSPQEKSFLNSSNASVLLPLHSEKSFVEAFPNTDGENSLQDLLQRDILFFDERLTIYVVLHVPQCPEDELKSYLSRLELKVEVWATSNSHVAEPSPGGVSVDRDLVSSEKVNVSDDPIVLVSLNEGDDQIYLNLVWELPLQLKRPRLRLQDVQVAFIPVAVISPVQTSVSDEAYLEPFKPQVENLFEPLKSSRGFESEMPYLPITRLSTVLPALPKDDPTFHLRSTPSPSIPTHLAFATRLRYSRPSIEDITQSLIASLDVEVIPFVDVEGQIEIAELKLQRGKVFCFTEKMLPTHCRSKDCITFLYRLENGDDKTNFQTGMKFDIDTVNVHIRFNLELSEDCRPLVEMKWTTNIDFAQLLHNTSNQSGATTRRLDPTPNLSIDSKSPNPAQTIGTSLQPSLHVGAQSAVTVSFAATKGLVKVGVPFSWQVLIVNKGSKPAKLAIIPLPRVQKPTSQVQQYAKRHATRSSVNSVHLGEKNNGAQQADVALAVVDENIVYAMQHAGAVPPETDLMSLTPELRVGPLGPGQCHEGELKLIALKAGAFTLDAVRVVDLAKEIEQGYGGSSVVMDIRELPDVIVEEVE